MNMWHKLKPMLNGYLQAVIEIPKGSRNKYELDKETGKIKIDRVIHLEYPFNYGFIPQTLSEDGDPTDVILISDAKLSPGMFVTVKPVGIINMIDHEVKDPKILCVPSESDITNLNQIDTKTLKNIRDFLLNYKKDGIVDIIGIKDKLVAKKEIGDSIKRYKEKFG